MEKRDTRRRFEQWANNPECEANAASAILGASMVEVAKKEGPAGQGRHVKHDN